MWVNLIFACFVWIAVCSLLQWNSQFTLLVHWVVHPSTFQVTENPCFDDLRRLAAWFSAGGWHLGWKGSKWSFDYISKMSLLLDFLRVNFRFKFKIHHTLISGSHSKLQVTVRLNSKFIIQNRMNFIVWLCIFFCNFVMGCPCFHDDKRGEVRSYEFIHVRQSVRNTWSQ